MQKGTHHTEEARTRISITKSLQAEIARRALTLKADPTNVEKQMALAEALDAYEVHKNTLAGAFEKAIAQTPVLTKSAGDRIEAAHRAAQPEPMNDGTPTGRDMRGKLNMTYPDPNKKDIFQP
jgi:hypothetical protein